ncbi:MAG: sigma 54-interacting transcriptional regulator [Treponema sp.]|jgi:Nif-specific regulatory protein|nr:sigma 54-interacting transcriptional regulator [Treponema sp.]
MQDLFLVAAEAAKTDLPVLIFGESGSGKSRLAEYIHQKSGRAAKSLGCVRCGGVSPVMWEREFRDVLVSCADGTLFLEEISSLSAGAQKQLLTALKGGFFEDPDTGAKIPVRLRIIAAAARDMESLVEGGDFLSDLYYRLNVFPLFVPPLRKRQEDIAPLAQLFLDKYGKEKGFAGFSEEALGTLQACRWPGNIRELENAVQRGCAFGTAPFIQARDLRLQIRFSGYALALRGDDEEQDKSLKTALTHFKKAYLTRILNETAWNQTRAAKVLDIQRTYVSRLLRELKIREIKQE